METHAPRHPGLDLLELLNERHIQSSRFADDAKLSRSLVTQITKMKRRITPKTATAIAKYFPDSGDAKSWLARQLAYDAWFDMENVGEERA